MNAAYTFAMEELADAGREKGYGRLTILRLEMAISAGMRLFQEGQLSPDLQYTLARRIAIVNGRLADKQTKLNRLLQRNEEISTRFQQRMVRRAPAPFTFDFFVSVSTAAAQGFKQLATQAFSCCGLA